MTNRWRDRWSSRLTKPSPSVPPHKGLPLPARRAIYWGPGEPLISLIGMRRPTGKRPIRSRRNAITRLCLGLFLTGYALTVAAAPLLKSFSASFSVSRGVIPLGSLDLKFTLGEAGDYRYLAYTQPGLITGWFSGDEITEESQGRLVPGGVVSEHYRYNETNDQDDNVEVRFDWPARKAYTTSDGITWAQAIGPDTQDRLSQQLMVRLQLAEGRDELSYQVADGGKLKRYHFKVVGEEPVDTPYGRLPCLKVRRSKESRPPDYTIWFAPKLDYLPVRIEREKDGNHYHMVLDELEGLEGE